MSSLAGKSCLVTGASAGIGAATARALAAAGAEVVLAARRAQRLERLERELAPRASALVLDVSDAAAVERALAGRSFDFVLANAGFALGTDKLDAGSTAEWSQVIDTNVKGVLHVVRAVLPAMVARGRGDLVLLGSVAGRYVYPGGAVYCASKHAVRALYEGLRLDLAGKGLRVSTVDPGMVKSEFSLVRMRGDAARAEKVYEGMQPLMPEDVAEAILWIATRAPHVNVGELVLWPTDQASVSVVKRAAQ
jgi:serine 3-dehydrogenase